MRSNILRSAIIAALGISYQAHAYDCTSIALWDNGSVYNSGDHVQQSNIAYKASYWTQGNDPATNSGPWEAWQNLGQCENGGSNTPPDVSISSPINNASIPEGTITSIQANASDSDGNVEQVEFFANNLSIATITQPPFKANWTSTIGTSSISAVATDNKGASSTSTIAISVTPASGLVPPSISLTSPDGSEQLTVGDSLLMTASASDSDGIINQVEFYVDNILVATDTAEPFQHSWTAESGVHAF